MLSLELFIPYKEAEISFWRKQTWGVWRFAGVMSIRKQECRLLCSLTWNICWQAPMGPVLVIILLLACIKHYPLTHHQTPGVESRELERTPWFRETHPSLTSATSLHRPFTEQTSFHPGHHIFQSFSKDMVFFFSFMSTCWCIQWTEIFWYIWKIFLQEKALAFLVAWKTRRNVFERFGWLRNSGRIRPKLMHV